MLPETFTCSRCLRELPTKTSGGTGYGRDRDGAYVCYDCCAVEDRAEMTEHGRIMLYLSNGEVMNWPGTLRFPAHVRKGRHNIAGSRYDVWFAGPDGFQWHGVQYGDNTQICHCKRTKQVRNA